MSQSTVQVRTHHPHDVPDDLVRAMYELTRRAELEDREDPPFWSLEEFAGAVRTARSDEARDLLLAWDGDTLVGTAVMFRSQGANRDKARLMVDVDVTARRRGVGRALVDALAEVAAADGRTVLMGETVAPGRGDPTGHGHVLFARACGFEVAQVERLRHLALPVEEARLRALLQDADPGRAGYALETLVDDVPQDLRASLTRLHARLVVDMPSGGVDYEEEEFGEEHLVERLESVRAMGRLVYETVAVTADRTVVAQSTLAVPVDPAGGTDAYQWGTYVDRDHRGHRLGLAVKAANLLAVQRDRPRLTRAITQNADTNDHMVAINQQLGFRPVESMVDLVRRL